MEDLIGARWEVNHNCKAREALKGAYTFGNARTKAKSTCLPAFPAFWPVWVQCTSICDGLDGQIIKMSPL